jgi:hypothetical protein
MDVSLKLRDKVKMGEVNPGEAFLPGNGDHLHLVVDLTQEDMFTESPVLRNDSVYAVELETGVVRVFPRNVVVELVPAVVTEGPFSVKSEKS